MKYSLSKAYDVADSREHDEDNDITARMHKYEGIR
jgi:hypothetical protein